MALRVRDRVLEVTTTTGTGGFTLAGGIVGFQSFASGVGDGNTCYYAVVHHDLQNFPQWEVGKGTLSGATLSRDTILDSSDGPGNKISLSAGVKNVFVTIPGEKAVMKDVDGRVFIGSGVINPTQDNMLYVDGDIKASGINVESGVIIQQSPTPDPSTNKLYNFGGNLYWGSNIISSSDSLFNISAASGTADMTGDVLGIDAGSGIFFNGGENVNISISDLGNGSGQLTFDVPNASTDFLITADSGLNSLNILQGSGISFVGANGIGVTLTDRVSPTGTGLPVLGGSGVITITGPDLSNFASVAGTGININQGVISGIAGSTSASGIVLLSNTVADDETKALTPKAVYDANYLSSFPVTASNGLGHFDVTTVSGVASGLFFKSGANTTVTLTRAADGSGVITIDSTDTVLTATSGIVLDGDNVIRHEDTSTQASVNNAGNSFIQDITLDEYGHITAINSASATGIGTRLMLGGSDGIGNIQLEDGSGIFVVGGTNVNVTLSDIGNGSGILTIEAPTAVGVNLEGSPTAVSGGMAFFNGPTSIAYDSAIVWDSGNSEQQINGTIKLDQITAPRAGITTDRLYNVGGNLTWNGTNLLSGGGAGATSEGSPTPQGSGIAFWTSSNTIAYDTALTWDSGNNRLGVNVEHSPTSTLHNYGSFAGKIKPFKDSYSAADDYVIQFNGAPLIAGGTGILDLPATDTCLGRVYHIINNSISPSGLLIRCSGTETIKGSLQFTGFLPEQTERLWLEGDVISLVASSGSWEVLNRDYTPHTASIQVHATGFRQPWGTTATGGTVTTQMGFSEVQYSYPSGMVVHRSDVADWIIGQPSIAITGSLDDGYKVQGFNILRDSHYLLKYDLHSNSSLSPYYDNFFVTINGAFTNTEASGASNALNYFRHKPNSNPGLHRVHFANELVVFLHSGDFVSLKVGATTSNLLAHLEEDEENIVWNGASELNRTGEYEATRFTIKELR